MPADEASRDALAYLYERKQEKSRKKAGTKEGAAVPATADAEDFEQFLLRTSFDGAFGRILCIGYAIDDGPVDALTGDERDILVRFWELARSVSRYVGHNVMEFDLRFIYQRSIVCGVRPSVNLSFARYRSDPIYDTMKEWVKWLSTNVGLEHLALALGIPTPKEGIDGSQVFDFYKAGKHDEIADYCKRDVETTRA
ncbi:MAG: ribonuclease H-like domain-containing protein, partial [Thermoanaerobaculia bacterium]